MSLADDALCIDLTQPRVMGIVNVTPDSFFGRRRPRQRWHGAGALRAPGAARAPTSSTSVASRAAPAPQACRQPTNSLRVLPVLRGALSLGVPVSVDTCKPEVMRAALDLGVDIVNDILALQAPGAIERSRRIRPAACA